MPTDWKDKLPPYSEEAEQGVLGCCLLDPGNAIGACVERFRGLDAFYDERHKTLFQFLQRMHDHGKQIDSITIIDGLANQGITDACGGMEYVISLQDTVPSAGNLPAYLEIVREKALLRVLRQLCGHIATRIDTDDHDVAGLLDWAEGRILALNEARVEKKEETIRDVMVEVTNRMEEYHRGGAQMTGLPTGFDYVDKMLCGLNGGEFIVLAARPGQGKTSIGMNIIEHLAIEKNVPCGVFSLEMTNVSLGARLLFQHARADFQRYRTGFMENGDIPKLVSATGRIAKSPIYLDDTPGVTLMEVRARTRRWVKQYGVKLILIDYLQLMEADQAKRSRAEEVGTISKGIKRMAKELNIPVIVLAQLNREIEKDKNRKPQLSDLRESGDVEQDADVVGFLYKPQLDEDEEDLVGQAMQSEGISDWSKQVWRSNLLIAKQRNGPTGDCELLYYKSSMLFKSYKRPHRQSYQQPQPKSQNTRRSMVNDDLD